MAGILKIMIRNKFLFFIVSQSISFPEIGLQKTISKGVENRMKKNGANFEKPCELKKLKK